MSRKIYIESLLSLGGKQNKDSIDYIIDNLLIRDKKSKIEYTVKKIVFDKSGKPEVICYRYYGPNKGSKKVFIKIPYTDFNKFERV